MGAKAAALLAVLILGGASTTHAEAITVFAAASLRDALGEIAQHHEAETGDQVTLVFAASSTLARQVAQGAPADVILLADRAWANWLVENGTLDAATPFATNRLVLIARDGAPLDDPAHIPAGLADGHLAVAQIDAVPAGRYAKAALTSLGLWDAVAPQVVQANNVRAALRFVDQGEALLGIGYASDLQAFPALSEIYRFEQDTHPEIVFSGGVITPRGQAFVAYLHNGQGQAVLSDWGFLPTGGQ